MSRPIPARKKKRALPPTPHVFLGGAGATSAEKLARALGLSIVGSLQRGRDFAFKGSIKDRDKRGEVYGQRLRPSDYVWYTIAGALYEPEYRHLEELVVLQMLDMAEILRKPLTIMGYSKVLALLRDAAPALTAALAKKEVARVEELRQPRLQGDLFAMDGGAL